MPQAQRIGILADPTTISTGAALQQAASALGIELVIEKATDRGEVERALEGLIGARIGAVNVLASPILFAHHALMIERLNRARLPSIYQWPEGAADGALAAYGPRWDQVNRLLAIDLDRVLRGAKPADIPIEQPTRFDLAINLRSAKAMGFAVPQAILARADEVIE